MKILLLSPPWNDPQILANGSQLLSWYSSLNTQVLSHRTGSNSSVHSLVRMSYFYLTTTTVAPLGDLNSSHQRGSFQLSSCLNSLYFSTKIWIIFYNITLHSESCWQIWKVTGPWIIWGVSGISLSKCVLVSHSWKWTLLGNRCHHTEPCHHSG